MIANVPQRERDIEWSIDVSGRLTLSADTVQESILLFPLESDEKSEEIYTQTAWTESLGGFLATRHKLEFT